MLLAYQENGLPSHDDSPKVSGEGNGKVRSETDAPAETGALCGSRPAPSPGYPSLRWDDGWGVG